MIIYTHSYDIFDEGQTWGRHARLRTTEVKHITLGPRDTVSNMASKIMRAAGSHRSIWTLILNAHGMVDRIHHRPTGALGISDAETLSPPTARHLTPLRPYFTPNGNGLEIHGCNILAARDGWRLCQLLSQNLQISVYAACSEQRGISPWGSSTPADRRGGFEGPVMAFRPPNGNYENVTLDFRRRGLQTPT
ncbi:MAG: hypothetical protein OES26_12030 [Gammaproteobacteria bacterium]|nr:hypothetical protein [Gammaproteobacteria bacterium]